MDRSNKELLAATFSRRVADIPTEPRPLSLVRRAVEAAKEATPKAAAPPPAPVENAWVPTWHPLSRDGDDGPFDGYEAPITEVSASR